MTNARVVHTGEVLAGRAPGRIVALGVGSCLAVALWDEKRRVGGLAHVPLPALGSALEPPGWGVESALRLLVAQLRKLGADRGTLTAKAAGAASLLGGSEPSPAQSIARRNVAALQAALAKLGIPLISQALGGAQARIVGLDLADGRLRVRSLGEEERAI